MSSVESSFCANLIGSELLDCHQIFPLFSSGTLVEPRTARKRKPLRRKKISWGSGVLRLHSAWESSLDDDDDDDDDDFTPLAIEAGGRQAEATEKPSAR